MFVLLSDVFNFFSNCYFLPLIFNINIFRDAGRTGMRWLTLGYVTVLLYHLVLGWGTHGQFPNPILSKVRIKY